MKKMFKRPDGRNFDELRPIQAEVGIIKNATGSASFAFGNSKAIAAVYGPRQLYPQHLQDPEKCLLRCYYDLASFSVLERKKPGPSRRSTEISLVMTKALEPALILEKFPNTVIDVYVLIVQADASTRCAAINAASMALAHAGILMHDLVGAVSVGKVGGNLIVDLTKAEEDFQDEHGKTTDIPIAMLARSNRISLIQLDGSISKEELNKAVKLAKKVMPQIIKAQRDALKKLKQE